LNREDFQTIAGIRLKEAKSLLDSGHYDGAYYLAGYAVECSLKACIAKQTKEYDFPDKKTVERSYSHDFEQLLKVAGLEKSLRDETKLDTTLEVNWAIVKDWSEDARYRRNNRKQAEDLYQAIATDGNGVLQWLRKHW
jgi:HEPN domain-containing protein